MGVVVVMMFMVVGMIVRVIVGVVMFVIMRVFLRLAFLMVRLMSGFSGLIALRLATLIARDLAAFFFFLMTLRFRHQAFAVGHRDLIIVGMDFSEGEETVTVPTVIDKGCLKRGLNPDHFGQVNIAFDLLLS